MTAASQPFRFGIVLPKPLIAKVGVTRSKRWYMACLKSIDEESKKLARRGCTEQREYAELQRDRVRIARMMMDDPRFAVGRDFEVAELQSSAERDRIEAVIGIIVRRFQQLGDAEARKREALDAFYGPASENVRLSSKMRESGFARLLAELDEAARQERRKSFHLRRALKSAGVHASLQPRAEKEHA